MTPAALARTYAAAFPDDRPWTETEFATLFQSPGVKLVGDDVCFLIGRLVANEAEILTLATHPDHRRKGLARTVLGAFERSNHPEAASIFLEVDASNTAARALYSTCGYAQVGLRRGYYKRRDRPATDALILSKNLT